MADQLNSDTVRQVGKLARLNLSEQEVKDFTVQLSAILDYVDQLNDLDTGDVEPLAHCLPLHNVFRQDVPGTSLTPQEALANAPQRDGDFFVVPKVLGGDGA